MAVYRITDGVSFDDRADIPDAARYSPIACVQRLDVPAPTLYAVLRDGVAAWVPAGGLSRAEQLRHRVGPAHSEAMAQADAAHAARVEALHANAGKRARGPWLRWSGQSPSEYDRIAREHATAIDRAMAQ